LLSTLGIGFSLFQSRARFADVGISLEVSNFNGVGVVPLRCLVGFSPRPSPIFDRFGGGLSGTWCSSRRWRQLQFVLMFCPRLQVQAFPFEHPALVALVGLPLMTCSCPTVSKLEQSLVEWRLEQFLVDLTDLEALTVCSTVTPDCSVLHPGATFPVFVALVGSPSMIRLFLTTFKSCLCLVEHWLEQFLLVLTHLEAFVVCTPHLISSVGGIGGQPFDNLSFSDCLQVGSELG
jgi:hypothetical protein